MGILDKIEPKEVMHWFEEISSIPRGSLKEEKIAAFLVNFARERGYEYSEDDYHNVVIRKPASPGYEKKSALILQAHIDMICVKDPGVDHDFENDGLELYIDGDHVRARGTTLGADDGIGVAYELAILDDKMLQHPPIEAVFTTAEEIGMVGAIHFDVSQLTGKRMINFDAGGFTEGRIYVGCAGNQHLRLKQAVSYTAWDRSGKAFDIAISGLRGGHAGGDIHEGRGNTSLIMGRLMSVLTEGTNTKVAYFESGDTSQDNKNGIPGRGKITICTMESENVAVKVKKLETILKDELSDVDDGITFTIQPAAMPEKVLSDDVVKTAIKILRLLPNGVQSMQRAFPDTPECSCNIGNVEISDDQSVYYLSIRSCKNTLMDQMCAKYATIAELLGCSLTLGNRLPSWDYDKNSHMKEIVEAEYIKEFGKNPRFKVTHASTECSMFKVHDSEIDIISMGPIIYEEHTTKEYLGIWSVGVLWKFLKEILKQL